VVGLGEKEMSHFIYSSPNVEAAGLSGLNGVVDQTQYLYSIADGSVAKQLNQQRSEIASQKSEIDQRHVDVNQMPDGASKVQAATLLTQADKLYTENLQRLNKAIGDHNEVVASIKKYSLGLVNPPTVSTLSALPLLPVAAIIGAVGFLVLALSVAIPAITNSSKQTKGILEQVSELVQAGGGVVSAVGVTMTKTMWAVFGVLVAFLGYQLVQDLRKGKKWSKTSPTIFPSTSVPKVLKPVTGEVLS
jgi:hypothetical protein